MTLQKSMLVVALCSCFAASAVQDLLIPIIANEAFLARLGGAYVRDKAIAFMFDQSKVPTNGTEVTVANTQPSLPRQIANVLTGINLGVTLWTLGSMGLKKAIGVASHDELKLFNQAYSSGMDVFVAMEAARDTYHAVRAIANEHSTAMIPAYVYTFVPNALASYYSFYMGAKAGAHFKKGQLGELAFALTMWNIGITLCMTAKEAIAVLGEKVGITSDCKACSAVADAAQQLAYVTTGIIPGLLALWKINRDLAKKPA